MQKPIKKTLKNGLRIVTVPMKDNPTVTVMVMVGVGSDYETKKLNGISHFLEHMCFKGTIRRPSAQAISHELDALGAQYNAFTDHEMTAYYAKSDSKNFKKIFDVVSDVYLNSTFPDAEIQKEKGVIVEEINMYEDMPIRHVQDVFQEVLYKGQPAGWNIAGTKDNVRAMTRDDFIKYKKMHYVAKSTVIVVTGSINTKEVYKEASKHFLRVHTGEKSDKIKTKDIQTMPEVILKYKDTDQAHFVLGVRTFPLGDLRNPILSVISGILGAGMSSRLFIKLREKMGVAYYVRAENNASLDHGSFQISAGVNNARVEEVIKEILQEFSLLTKEKVSEKELSKVKSYLVGNMKLSLEATDDIAGFYGTQELMRKEIKTLDEKIKSINKVTAKDIQKMAIKIFKNNHLNLAIIGPYKDRAKFEKLLHL